MAKSSSFSFIFPIPLFSLARILSSVTPSTHPGLLGICLSGAGPTILALSTSNEQNIADTIVQEFKKENIECEVRMLEVTEEGASVKEE